MYLLIDVFAAHVTTKVTDMFAEYQTKEYFVSNGYTAILTNGCCLE
jgi:hypothetical protein